MEKSNFDYQKEIEAYQKKIKGYEILNTLYQKNLDQCKGHNFLIKQMEERMRHLEEKLEESEKKELKVQEFYDMTSMQPIRHSNISDSSDDESLKDLETEDGDIVEKRQFDEILKCEEIDPGGIKERTLDVIQQSEDREKDSKQDESRLSSFGSFVRVNESPAGDIDEFRSTCGDDKDAQGSRVCCQFSENIDTIVEPKQKKSKKYSSLELELKAMIEKIKIFEPSSNAITDQSSDFFTDIKCLTKKMLQFYGCSQAIQTILEKFEKENKELKTQLNSKECIKRNQVETEQIYEEKNEMQRKITELVSCKKALMNMMENKERQFLQLKQHVRTLKANIEKMKMACYRVSKNSQENSKKWQKDYSKLQEQLKKTSGERDHEIREVNNLKSEVRHLKRRLEDLMHLKMATESDRHDSSEVDILKQQIAIYMEDFNNERHDREKAQAMVERLQKKLDSLSKSFSELSAENTKLLENYHHATSGQHAPSTAKIFRIRNQRGPNYLGPTLHPTAPQEDSVVHPMPWQCPSCTFINNGWITYCLACDQSRC